MSQASVVIRFWTKVDCRNADECWLWKAATNGQGYGAFSIGSRILHTKRAVLAHRQAWELTYGPIPDGLCVLHHCDTPRCCNPSHLWLGSIAENNADMVAKGRDRKACGEASGIKKKPWAFNVARGEEHWTRKKPWLIEHYSRGEAHPQSKLKNSDVLEIRRLYNAGGQTHRSLARKFSVDPALIGLILNGRIWKHLL